jgi:hypothetical protein
MHRMSFQTLLGCSITVGANSLLYVNVVVFLVYPEYVRHSPWLSPVVFGIHAASVLNNAGMLLVAGVFKKCALPSSFFRKDGGHGGAGSSHGFGGFGGGGGQPSDVTSEFSDMSDSRGHDDDPLEVYHPFVEVSTDGREVVVVAGAANGRWGTQHRHPLVHPPPKGGVVVGNHDDAWSSFDGLESDEYHSRGEAAMPAGGGHNRVRSFLAKMRVVDRDNSGGSSGAHTAYHSGGGDLSVPLASSHASSSSHMSVGSYESVGAKNEMAVWRSDTETTKSHTSSVHVVQG